MKAFFTFLLYTLPRWYYSIKDLRGYDTKLAERLRRDYARQASGTSGRDS